MTIPFYKYHGTGNDFVILDNRDGQFSKLTEEDIRFLCHRHFGIGADGLLLFQEREGYDFEMVYFNANGLPGTMCGNGGRCMVRFAIDQDIKKFTYRFRATDGDHEAELDNDNEIRLKMADVFNVVEKSDYSLIDTGSPHYLQFVKEVAAVDVEAEGKAIRSSSEFEKEGVNVNFIERTGDGIISVRTYERGVEAETMSCGTGVTAAALASAHNPKGFNRIEVHTPGGILSVEFNKVSDTIFDQIWLCGDAKQVFKGEITLP